MHGRFADNPAYVEYETLLKALHVMDAEGRGQSDEADDLREEMETRERLLSRPEKNRLAGLSADLYMLQGDEVLEEPFSPPLSTDEFKERLQEAQDWNDWEAVLALLRRRPTGLPPEAVAVTRARAYDALGHHDTAIRFLDFAYRADRLNTDYRALRMVIAQGAGQTRELLDEALNVMAQRDTPPKFVIVAADVLLQHAETLDDPGKRDLLERILSTLRPICQSADADRSLPPALASLAHLVRAGALWDLRQHDAALVALDAATDADPSDLALRHGRDRIRRQAIHNAGAGDEGPATADPLPRLATLSAMAVSPLSILLDHRRDLLKRALPLKPAA